MTLMAPPTPCQPAAHFLPPVRFERCVPLEPDAGAAARARAAVEDAVSAWGVAVDVDVAVLLTSELVTNAVIHGTRGRPAAAVVTLAIAADAASGLRVDVHDASDRLPVAGQADENAESGRGLTLVASLSDEWGFYRAAHGKTVYFALKPVA